MATSLKDCVVHWRKKLERNNDEDVILNVVRKLSKVPITMELVQETGICKTLQTKAKEPGVVGEKVDSLLKKWRLLLASSIKSPEKPNKQHDHKKESKHNSTKHHSKEHRQEKNNNCVSSDNYTQSETNNHISNKSSQNYHNSEKKKHKENDTYNPECVKTHLGKSKKLFNEHNSDIEEGYKPPFVDKKDLEKSNKSKHLSNINDYSSSEDVYVPSPVKRVLVETDRKSKFSSKCNSLLDGVYEPSALKKKKVEDTSENNISYGNHNSVSKHSKQNSIVEPAYEPSEIKVKTHENSETKEIKKSKKHKSASKELHTESSKKKDKAESSKKPHSSDTKSSKLSSENRKVKDKSSDESSKPKKKIKINAAEEFTSSEARFEDCLGLNDIVTKKKKKSKKPVPVPTKALPVIAKSQSQVPQKSRELHKVTNDDFAYVPVDEPVKKVKKEKKDKKSSSSSSSSQPSSFEVPKPPKDLIDVDIESTLPQTMPIYRPLPQRSMDLGSPLGKKKVMSNEEAIKFTSSRREKTAVYSGRKSNFHFPGVPSLFNLCIQLLVDNINNIEQITGIPYHVIKPVLERCTPDQLFVIENYNPYLLEDTHELWELHCKRDYKSVRPQECETWRELYCRAQDEREAKLKNITANISASMHKSNPVRQVKLAYVDSVVKPPRDVARRQAKHGTGLPVNHTVKPGPPSKATPRPVAPAINTSTSSPPVYVPPKKPKVAPLMAKTLKSMKACFRRK